ncbi:MAG TPA: WG repeat-containing protein [Candidatus Didemnitutus sp.]|nr:WG repeat-containing protein [Candidatus Didemnitutus sp.]
MATTTFYRGTEPAKVILLAFIIAVLTSCVSGQDESTLHLVREGDLWGYIDKRGSIVVDPQFRSAGGFSEGLAPVRLHGTYGYIDKTGSFVISPRFDLALPFNNGIASVYIDGKATLIDTNGVLVFQHHFNRIFLANGSKLAVVESASGAFGVINRSGKLIIDTAFSKIGPFVDGLSVVQGRNHQRYVGDDRSAVKYEIGVVDTSGKWIVPYGRYRNIYDYTNGYATAGFDDTSGVGNGWSSRTCVINAHGKQLFVVPSKNYVLDFMNGGYSNGVAVVSIYSVDVDTMKSWKSWERSDFKGVIDTNGRILFSDTSWRDLSRFTDNRAFVRTGDESWRMIDITGRFVGDSVYDNVMFESPVSRVNNSPFIDGMALVKSNNAWYGIDTNGNALTQHFSLDVIDERKLHRHGDFVLLQNDISTLNSTYSYTFGFLCLKNSVLVEPRFHYVDIDDSHSNMIYAMIDGVGLYIDNTGRTIWQEEDSSKEPSFLNIDFMNRGYFYARSRSREGNDLYDNWGHSSNGSRPITPNIDTTSAQLQLVIDLQRESLWAERYKGAGLFVSNASRDTLYFPAQDGRLDLTIQAKDRTGLWRDIEYLPSSWCGNSSHTLSLPPHEQWEFATPIYTGEFKTKIRAKLQFKKSKDQGSEDIIFSNEINGSINPGQFWNKRQYSPRGIMDPYND